MAAAAAALSFSQPASRTGLEAARRRPGASLRLSKGSSAGARRVRKIGFRDSNWNVVLNRKELKISFCCQKFEGQWWSQYGFVETPHLTLFTVKVLSQTVSPFQCERNWNTFALIHTKPKNRLTIKKLEKLVFIHYNMRLRNKNLGKNNDEPIDLDQVFEVGDPLIEWIRETEDKLFDDRDNEWLDDTLAEDQSREPVCRDSSVHGAAPAGSRRHDDDDDDDDDDGDGGAGSAGDSGGGTGTVGAGRSYDDASQSSQR